MTSSSPTLQSDVKTPVLFKIIQQKIVYYLLDCKVDTNKNKLSYDLVCRQWLEWIGEWVSDTFQLSFTSRKGARMCFSQPAPLVDCLLHSDLGPKYLHSLVSTDHFTGLYHKPDMASGYAPYPKPHRSTLPLITVWKAIKHIEFDSTYQKDLITMMKSSSSPRIIEAAQSFIMSLESIQNPILPRLMSDLTDLLPTLNQRVALGKSPIILHTTSSIPTSELNAFQEVVNTLTPYFQLGSMTVGCTRKLYPSKSDAFTAVTSLEITKIKTVELVSSWLTPHLFPSLQTLVIHILDDHVLKAIKENVLNQFSTITKFEYHFYNEEDY
ncbi:hypothetical protein DFA_05025 [Cavenderia fasciculata]|uniref:Uncharacterized protein n=1 Tax=Cavenderia fasciculata TaxID=261658 RepID=F4PN02_CACFS|nr:uncharacterized protein DFA_05025 [Cavenderia fasciculata]EGG22895.1 hypothetical protein DFA_05025 [Cavenderia fasciculata]|eukprot:XP_004360746.1 hypothetical protein DFA_05025 [Cavenderia fasciculata]